MDQDAVLEDGEVAMNGVDTVSFVTGWHATPHAEITYQIGCTHVVKVRK